MGANRVTMAAALLGTVAAVGMMGCKGSTPDKGQALGAANVAVHSNLSISDVSKVTLTVQSASLLPTPVNVPLVLKGGQFSAVVNNLVVGSDYVFTADAKDASSNSLFHGSASGVSITKGNTAQVTLLLGQVNPGGTNNSAPLIDSVSFDANQVAQGGTVHLTAAAHDPDAGQTATLAFLWQPAANCGTISNATATGGSDSADRNATALYTAPAADVDCQINLTVTDALGASAKAAFSIRVGLGSAGSGSAKVSALVNGAPIISSLTSTPAQITPGVANTPGLAVVATDPENDTLSYAWTSNTAGCQTTFASPTSATTAFTVASVTAGTKSCTFTVSINDGVWPGTTTIKNTVVSSLTLPVGAPAISAPPLFGLTYQSEDAIAGGDAVILAAVASDPAGGTLSYTYAWAVDANTGTAFTVGTDTALGLDPVFTTAGTWTVPAGAESASTATFTVTAKSSVSGLSSSQVFVFAPANNPCVSAADGTSCTIASNKCITAAVCKSKVCTAVTTTTCPTSTTACKDNVCDTSTGACGLVDQAAGSSCTDANGCTTGDACNGSGTCVGTAVTCPASTNVCSVAGACVSTGDATHTCPVTPASAGTACDDGDLCTGTASSGDHCDGNGACVAGAPFCGAGQSCTVAGTPPAPVCTAPPAVCAVTATYAEQFLPPFQGNAIGADGTPWIVGNIFNPFDFATNTNGCNPTTDTTCITSTGSADVFLAKLDPVTGLATASKSFGQVATPNSSDQTSAGVAVASNGNAAIIGQFSAEIDFTQNDSIGGVGTPGVDFLTTTLSSQNYVAVFDGTLAPVHSIATNVGTGALLSIASNPSQSAFAVCGKTSVKATGGLGGTSPTAGGGMDIVVAKINAATGLVLWGKQFGGAGDQICQSVTMDNNGDVIIAGSYNGTLQFGTLTAFPVVSDTTAALLFVAKLASADGTPTAASTWGTAGKVIPYGVTVDASSNIIVAGSLGATTVISNTLTLTDLGATDVFVLKLSTSLSPIWGKTFGDASFDQQAKSVATSSTGDIYVGGLFVGDMSNTLGIKSFSNTNSDGFVAHLGSDGSSKCAQVFGDAPGAQGVSSIAVARAATGALLDEVQFGGGFTSTVTVGSTKLDTTSPSLSQSYVARVSVSP